MKELIFSAATIEKDLQEQFRGVKADFHKFIMMFLGKGQKFSTAEPLTLR